MFCDHDLVNTWVAGLVVRHQICIVHSCSRTSEQMLNFSLESIKQTDVNFVCCLLRLCLCWSILMWNLRNKWLQLYMNLCSPRYSVFAKWWMVSELLIELCLTLRTAIGMDVLGVMVLVNHLIDYNLISFLPDSLAQPLFKYCHTLHWFWEVVSYLRDL